MKNIHVYQILFLIIQVLSYIPEPEKKFLLFKYAKKLEFDEVATFLNMMIVMNLKRVFPMILKK